MISLSNSFTELIAAIEEAHWLAGKHKAAYVVIQESEGYMWLKRRCAHVGPFDSVMYSTHIRKEAKCNMWPAKPKPLTLAGYHRGVS